MLKLISLLVLLMTSCETPKNPTPTAPRPVKNPYTIGVSLGINSAQTDENIARIADAGITYVEVTFNAFQRNVPEEEWMGKALAIKALLDKYGLKVWSCHMPFSRTLDISVESEAKRLQNVAIQEKMLREFVPIFKPQRLVLHPSSEPIEDAARPARIAQARKSIEYLAPIAKEQGAVLCIENLPRTCLGNTADELLEIVKDIPDVMVCFDTNHLLKHSHAHYFDVLGDRIGTTHVSDYDGEDERHWVPGKGIINWSEFIFRLRKCGYKGIFMFEVKSSAGVPADVVSAYRDVIDR